MSKASTRSLLALSILAVVAGCAKKEGGDAASTAAPAATPPAATTMPADHPTAKPAAEVDLTGIAKADGGKTVAEVYAEAGALSGESVTVRGKVVKANGGIMGKDWLHLRDGSGTEETNDLTVTRTAAAGDLPKVGDLVLVTGKVALERDYGMGYDYPVMLEEAEVKVEAAAQ